MKTPGIGWRNERALFWDEYVAADSIYFVQYNQCWGRELEAAHGNAARAAQLPSFIEFEEKIFKTLAEQPVKKLVIDMRFNGGGSEEQGNELMKRLKDHPVNKKGKLFVIIGRKTFSSAVLNALSFKTSTNAILVGEETSGSPNHYGEVKTMQLPSSRLSVEYSTRHFVRSGSEKPTLAPDVPVTVKFSDFYGGTDPFYDAVKNYK
jgi:C-terminal processing protease CtpA/Prc